jgi:thiol-disulfide isomerase/thioredoxin
MLVACFIIEGKSDIELKKGHVIIEGKASNFKDNSKVLRFVASGIADIDQIATLDSLGNFRTEFELFNPQDVELIYEAGSAYFYLKPADSLYVEIDGDLFKQNQFPNFEVSGSNSSTSRNIRNYFEFHNPYAFVPKYERSVKEFLNDLKKQIAVEDSVLHEFNIKNKPTKEFMIWAKKNMTYIHSNYIDNYFAQYDRRYKQQKVEIFNSNLFPVDDDSAIVSSLYYNYLSFYSGIKYSRCDSIEMQLMKTNNFRDADKRLMNNIIENEKPGLSRDIMIYNAFINLIIHPFKDYFERVSVLWRDYSKYISNSVLLELLKEKKDSFEKQQKNKETILNIKDNTKSETISKFWNLLHSKHKDKIIYIDIWGTWCSPCMSEISYSIELQKFYKDKPIAFVNLCLFTNKDDWEKVIDKSHFTGDNYFFNEGESNYIKDQLKFAGFPTYMIIDKNGNLIDKNAPRPSSGDEIKNLLNKMINK